MIEFNKELKSAARNYIRRTATVEELSFLFGNKECINAILSSDFEPNLRGQFVEFLRQEFLHFDGYTQYDKYGKVVEPADMIKGRYRSRYGIETIITEIAKCDVLCANCHGEDTHSADS